MKMVRPLEDYQLIGRECKHRNMFSGPVLMAEDLTTSYKDLELKVEIQKHNILVRSSQYITLSSQCLIHLISVQS